MLRDTRLVQTAVIGDEHSDVPILLPAEAIELDAFRLAHAHNTFWCGVLLGGCGAQLAHKLYVDRQCHFQHYPQPNGATHVCRRPRAGEASADHLYVKSAMSRSLAEYGLTGRFAYPPPIGSLLDVDLDDGVALLIHMDGSVPPNWAEGRTPVLGPGMVPEPGVLSSCPYVYRVRCQSDGAERRVWIGTQSLAHPTEWVPLTDCAWTDDGLITPAATEILQQRSRATGHAAAEATHRAGTVPENVNRFIRGLEAAQRAGTVEHVRQLCAATGPFLANLGTAGRTAAEQALEGARAWLKVHEDYQRDIFTSLDQAIAEKRAFDVRSQLTTAAALTRRGASASEQRTLAAARAFLREQDGLHGAGPPRVLLTPISPPPRPVRKRAKRQQAPGPREISGTKAKKQTKRQKAEAEAARRAERRNRRAAAEQARGILHRLDQRFKLHLTADEQRTLTEELSHAVQTADDSLTTAERREARHWTRRLSQPKNLPRQRPARRELPSHVLESAAAAVRGALKKAARAQTTTSWARLEQQLGSALPRMTRAERVQVLTLVDQATPADQALLSCLVAAGDPGMTSSYREIARALGLESPEDPSALSDVINADVQHTHHYWHHR
ncbi:hypothetical protein GZL_p00139 (plasmid) [Streptomyces sp. 769]|nr:hypothetical protein GZL_p00139 [Streptomyces sp. 769]